MKKIGKINKDIGKINTVLTIGLIILISIILINTPIDVVDASKGHGHGLNIKGGVKMGGGATRPASIHPPEPESPNSAHRTTHIRIGGQRGVVAVNDPDRDAKLRARGVASGKDGIGKIHANMHKVQCSICNMRGRASAKIAGKIGTQIVAKIGGISTNVSVDFPDNTTEITTVIYDPHLKEVIFIGKENYTMPSMDLRDFITALKVPNGDQWISIDLYENSTEEAPVSFGDTRLWNTSMGSKLLNGDYLLKNQTIDEISSCYLNNGCGSMETSRIWIQPSKVTLKYDAGIFTYDKINISVYYEGEGTMGDCAKQCWDSWVENLNTRVSKMSKNDISAYRFMLPCQLFN